jgi:hypothetical protein
MCSWLGSSGGFFASLLGNPVIHNGRRFVTKTLTDCHQLAPKLSVFVGTWDFTLRTGAQVSAKHPYFSNIFL